MYLNDIPLHASRALVHRKIAQPAIGGGCKVFLDAQARPFASLAKSDLLDTADICRLFPCSARTVYRWMSEGLLRPKVKVGREYLFTKGELVRWLNERPSSGRPLTG